MVNRVCTNWLLMLALVVAGCATTTKINWQARVGTYTYDQAVTDFGPPDKSAKLSNGSIVAQWQQQPAQVIVTPGPYFAPPGCYYYGPFAPTYSTTRFPASYLRLTFGPNGRLEQFKQFAQ
ncbi:MAG TPA: hypothetical protein VFY06_05505 [Verrucomicrobiae bacterium]|nr:hypothetical protein [Verrucomicrobiae bacterium]